MLKKFILYPNTSSATLGYYRKNYYFSFVVINNIVSNLSHTHSKSIRLVQLTHEEFA